MNLVFVFRCGVVEFLFIQAQLGLYLHLEVKRDLGILVGLVSKINDIIFINANRKGSWIIVDKFLNVTNITVAIYDVTIGIMFNLYKGWTKTFHWIEETIKFCFPIFYELKVLNRHCCRMRDQYTSNYLTSALHEFRILHHNILEVLYCSNMQPKT